MVCSRSTRTCWVGRETHGGYAELSSSAMVYLYSVQASALAMVVLIPYLEVARWLYRKLVAVAALMLGVFINMSYAPRLSIRAGFRVSWGAWQKRCSATLPHSHRSSVSSNILQLSCFKLGVRGPCRLALLAGGLGICTEAQQPLERKCSARDRMITQQAVS